MCGRYYIETDDDIMRDIYRETVGNIRPELLPLLKDGGEIYPTNVVPIRIKERHEAMKWGFARYDGKGQIINAKSETAMEKPMFSKAMRERRCLIPASGYYEWKNENGKKIKHAFCRPNSPILYLAGCYRLEKDSPFPVFVVLTREATPLLAEIHDRMPVIIPQRHIQDWLHGSPDIMHETLTDLRIKKVQ